VVTGGCPSQISLSQMGLAWQISPSEMSLPQIRSPGPAYDAREIWKISAGRQAPRRYLSFMAFPVGGTSPLMCLLAAQMPQIATINAPKLNLRFDLFA